MPIMSNTHTTTLNGEDLHSNEPIKTRKVRNSKFTSINFMTLPQIKKAKEVLNKKLGETGNSPAVNAKLTELLDEYERSEAEIRKWYRNYSNNPKTKELFQGKEILRELTIAKINGKTSYLRSDKHIKYGFRDKLRNTNLDKWGLGIGVTALGLGVAGQITSATAGKSLMQLLKIAIEAMWKNNPVALVALLGGAGLIAASKIVPAIDRTATKTARRIREDRMKVNAANNLAYEGANLEADAKFTEEANAQRPETQAEQPTVTPNPEKEEVGAGAGGTGSATTELEEEKENIDGTSGTETDTKPKDEKENVVGTPEENTNVDKVRNFVKGVYNSTYCPGSAETWKTSIKEQAEKLHITLKEEELDNLANEFLQQTVKNESSNTYRLKREGQQSQEQQLD